MGFNDDTGPFFSDKLIRKIFNSLSAHIAIIDESGNIIETNAAWKAFSNANGLDENTDFSRMNYLNICRSASGEGEKDAQNVASGITKVIKGVEDEFLYDYPCHSPQGPRWFYMRAVRLEDEGPKRVIISHEDITKLKLAQKELADKNLSLEEANVALKVLIRQREVDKTDMETTFLTNVKTLVMPYIEKLKSSRLSEKDKTLVGIIDTHIQDVISPMLKQFTHAGIMLTPQEIQVASLIKDGKTTAEIADILFVSPATVSFHRKNLRSKLGLTDRRANLRACLMSMS